MYVRGSIFVGFAGLIMGTALGCGSKVDKPGEDARYPIRSDWLVKGALGASGNPSKWYEPGYPPLFMLNQPFDTLTGDDAVLVGLVKSRVILNTRKDVDRDVREAFSDILTELFGTVNEPRVPSGDLLIQTMKLNEKLDDMRKSVNDDRAKVAKARSDAKTPEENQAVGTLETALTAATGELRKLEAKLDQLRSYESDLKLDPPTLAAGGVVYRNYCQQCHGLTGDGNGPGGRFLIPMPRDYRQGLFKFISTDPSLGTKRKPLRADLYRTIVKGLNGSPMPQFGALKEEEVQAVISYVIHLSIRGETEYEVMKKAADPNGDGLTKDEARNELFKEAADAAPRWVESGKSPIVPDPNPYVTQDQIDKSAENGFRLFTGTEVGCATCHTNFGRSAPYQFDSWGTIVRPRNLFVATFRGGRRPQDIYDRIYGGILGSNMPAHDRFRPTEDDKSKNINKVWDLVNFVFYVSESAKRQVLKEKFQIEIDE